MKPRIITGETLAAFRRHLQEAGAARPPWQNTCGRSRPLPGACARDSWSPRRRSWLGRRPWPSAARPQHRQRQAGGPEHLFQLPGLGECRVKPLRRQRELFRDPGRELDKGTTCICLTQQGKQEIGACTISWRPWPPQGYGCRNCNTSPSRPCTPAGPGWRGKRAAWSSSPPNCAGRWGSTAGSGALSPARCLSPGAAGRWTGPTSGGRCGPSAPRRGGGQAGLSPQLPPPLRPGVLCPGEGHCKAGGPLGPRQRGDDTDLYHRERRGTHAPGGAIGPGPLTTEF